MGEITKGKAHRIKRSHQSCKKLYQLPICNANRNYELLSFCGTVKNKNNIKQRIVISLLCSVKKTYTYPTKGNLKLNKTVQMRHSHIELMRL